MNIRKVANEVQIELEALATKIDELIRKMDSIDWELEDAEK
jgi:hypothetical protein